MRETEAGWLGGGEGGRNRALQGEGRAQVPGPGCSAPSACGRWSRAVPPGPGRKLSCPLQQPLQISQAGGFRGGGLGKRRRIKTWEDVKKTTQTTHTHSPPV